MWAGTLSAPRPVAEALGLVSLGHRAGVAVRSPFLAVSGAASILAMAILGRPEGLFLDEPTTGLDPESRHRTWLLIRELLGAGATVVLTTHYLEEAEELADSPGRSCIRAGSCARAPPRRLPQASRKPATAFPSLSYPGTPASQFRDIAWGRGPASPGAPCCCRQRTSSRR